jgi:hypothetical protein
VQNGPAPYFYFLKHFRKYQNLAKIIFNYLFIRKRCIIYEDVQKNEIYPPMLSPCMLATIEIMPLVKH